MTNTIAEDIAKGYSFNSIPYEHHALHPIIRIHIVNGCKSFVA